MSRHGQVILDRMIEMIADYRGQRTNLRRLVDDLGSMYQSLDPNEQPAEAAWLEAFVPLDELITERSGGDVEAMRAQIDRNLAVLERMLEGCRRTAILGAQ